MKRFIPVLFIAGCFAGEVALKGGAYSGNLEECNRTATTKCESIRCENIFRGQAGRMPRELPKHCLPDAGMPDGAP